jgi:hypothetical protein
MEQYRKSPFSLCESSYIDLRRIKIEEVELLDEFDLKCSVKLNHHAKSINEQFILTLKLYFSIETNVAVSSDITSNKFSHECVRQGIFPTHSKCVLIGEMLHYALKEQHTREGISLLELYNFKAEVLNSALELKKLGSACKKISSVVECLDLIGLIKYNIEDFLFDYFEPRLSSYYPIRIESNFKVNKHNNLLEQEPSNIFEDKRASFSQKDIQMIEMQSMGQKEWIPEEHLEDYSMEDDISLLNPGNVNFLQPFEPYIPIQAQNVSINLPQQPLKRNIIQLNSSPKKYESRIEHLSKQKPLEPINVIQSNIEILNPITVVKKTSSITITDNNTRSVKSKKKPPLPLPIQTRVQPLALDKSTMASHKEIISSNGYYPLQDTYFGNIEKKYSSEKSVKKITGKDCSVVSIDSRISISTFLKEHVVIPSLPTLEDEVKKIQTYGKLRGKVTTAINRNLMVKSPQISVPLPTDILFRIANLFLDEIFKESNSEKEIESARGMLRSFESVSRSFWKACSHLMAYYELTRLPKDFTPKISRFPLDIRRSISKSSLENSRSPGILYLDSTVLGSVIPSKDEKFLTLPEYAGIHVIYDCLKPHSYPFGNYNKE